MEVKAIRTPNTFEVFCYRKLCEDYPHYASKAGKLIDEGKTPDVIAMSLVGGRMVIGIWIFFACNYMVLTGIRPQ